MVSTSLSNSLSQSLTAQQLDQLANLQRTYAKPTPASSPITGFAKGFSGMLDSFGSTGSPFGKIGGQSGPGAYKISGIGNFGGNKISGISSSGFGNKISGLGRGPLPQGMHAYDLAQITNPPVDYSQGSTSGPNGSHAGAGAVAGGATGQRVGSISSYAGGNFDASSDQLIQAAADAHGIPPDFLKAIITKESSGDWANNSHSVASVRGGQRIFGYIGAFDDALQSWGIQNIDALEGNQAAQIDALATGLAGFYNQAKQVDPSYNWLNVASMHFSGQWNPSDWSDEMGQSSGQYVSDIQNWWRQLDAAAGNTWSADPTGSGTKVGQNADGSLTSNTNYNAHGVGNGSSSANGVIAAAEQYIGAPYVWGSIPTGNQDPMTTGWDCSGFVYWLNQHYGDGTLVEGSNQQYAQAQQNGKLFTDQNQLTPGDLVFFNTGDGEPAGHVAMYIGNGQIIQAANPDLGTLISNFTDSYYQNTFIGAEHMSWSGGTPGVGTTAQTSTNNQLSTPHSMAGSMLPSLYGTRWF